MNRTVSKPTIGILVVAGVFAGTALCADPPAKPDETALLRAELRVLRATVKSRAEEIQRLKAENARLVERLRRYRELWAKAGVEPPPEDPPQPTTAPADVQKLATYLYLGKPRPKLWFEEAYRKYGDKIVLVDGNYVDVGEALASGWHQTPLVGYVVAQVIGKDEVLLRHGAVVTMHVRGVDMRAVVDGRPFQANIVRLGTYDYRTSRGVPRTLTSWVVHVPLTKEQFADALAKGFRLVSYRTVRQRKPDGEWETKAVGTPVP